MRSFIHRAHLWLGVVVALPVLAWATSGLLYSLPRGIVEDSKIEVIEPGRVRAGAPEAMARANAFAGRKLPTTALTLLVRGGRPVYEAVGGMGADSLLIDAETGEVKGTPPPGLATRYFRQAHYYYFAGRWQTALLVVLSALASLSALSGIYLNLTLVARRRPPSPSRVGARAARRIGAQGAPPPPPLHRGRDFFGAAVVSSRQLWKAQTSPS